MKFETTVTKKESRWPLLQGLTQVSEQFNGNQLNSDISKQLLQYIHEERHQKRLT